MEGGGQAVVGQLVGLRGEDEVAHGLDVVLREAERLRSRTASSALWISLSPGGVVGS